jgi:hypothetical protein
MLKLLNFLQMLSFVTVLLMSYEKKTANMLYRKMTVFINMVIKVTTEHRDRVVSSPTSCLGGPGFKSWLSDRLS